METAQLNIREAKPSDYKEIKSVMDAWWGRSVSHLQHELFFDHFYNTAFIAEFNDGKIVGFINGFYSQTELSTAYVHFIGVDPVLRNSGLGKKLYERFFLVSREYGCSKLKSCTSKANIKSMEFHKHLGFSVNSDDPDKFRFEISLTLNQF